MQSSHTASLCLKQNDVVRFLHEVHDAMAEDGGRTRGEGRVEKSEAALLSAKPGAQHWPISLLFNCSGDMTVGAAGAERRCFGFEQLASSAV